MVSVTSALLLILAAAAAITSASPQEDPHVVSVPYHGDNAQPGLEVDSSHNVFKIRKLTKAHPQPRPRRADKEDATMSDVIQSQSKVHRKKLEDKLLKIACASKHKKCEDEDDKKNRRKTKRRSAGKETRGNTERERQI